MEANVREKTALWGTQHQRSTASDPGRSGENRKVKGQLSTTWVYKIIFH